MKASRRTPGLHSVRPRYPQEDTPIPSGWPNIDFEDPRSVYALLEARGWEGVDTWKCVYDLMPRIQAAKKSDILRLISDYKPPVANGPGFVLEVLLEQDSLVLVLSHFGSFMEVHGSNIPHKKEEILKLFLKHRHQDPTVLKKIWSIPNPGMAAWVLKHSQAQHRKAQVLAGECPTRAQQLARCCALNMDLIRWTKRKFNDQQHDPNRIRKWFTDQPGRLEGTGLTIDQLRVEHIIPVRMGGISYVYNYALVPKGGKSKSTNRSEELKGELLGRQSIGIALGFATWASVRTDVPFSQFNVANFMNNEVMERKHVTSGSNSVVPSETYNTGPYVR
jgi:hypothetical protein